MVWSPEHLLEKLYRRCTTSGAAVTSVCVQFDAIGGEIVEQTDTTTEQHGYEVNHQLIEQSGPQVRLGYVRAADDVDVLTARDCPASMRALTMPSVVAPAATCCGTQWVSTNTGAPAGWLPFHPFTRS
jgi:hypothetical protein